MRAIARRLGANENYVDMVYVWYCQIAWKGLAGAERPANMAERWSNPRI